jgi:hypothetical protein
MVSWHFDLLKRERFNLSLNEAVIDADDFDPEISTYVLLPFEQPTDSIKTMLESVRTFK